jgi:tRNA(adenine34) deaminase
MVTTALVAGAIRHSSRTRPLTLVEVSGAKQAYADLDEPWRVALDQAWLSWRSGCAGVGAVISDTTGAIVSVGRNRVIEERVEPGVLASTALAHGEMNALALLPLGPTEDLVLSTTFEPCLMCASAIVQARIPEVRYAAADPVFDGMHDWFASFPFAEERLPRRSELGGPVGAFCHVLHVSWMAFWISDGAVIEAHRNLRPRHLEIARQVIRDHNLSEVASEDGDVTDALEALWQSLVELSGTH